MLLGYVWWLCVGLVAALVIRLSWLMTGTQRRTTKRTTPVKCLIVLGSGGHTSEMLKLVGSLDQNRYSPRHYVIAATDTHSESKARQFEEGQMPIDHKDENAACVFHRVPRSREVGQSYITAIFTTARAFLTSFLIVAKNRPELILCNGPGTCVPIVASAMILKMIAWQNSRILYVESLARVKSLSLSGKLVRWVADAFLVQWKQLVAKYSHVKYIGRLC